MGNLHRVVVSGATALNLLFVGRTHNDTKPQVPKEKSRLPPPKSFYFTRLFPEMVYFQRFTREANN